MTMTLLSHYLELCLELCLFTKGIKATILHVVVSFQSTKNSVWASLLT